MKKAVLFQIIQFSISTQFKCWYCSSISTLFKCKNSKLLKPRFSFIWPIDRTLIRCNHSGPEWTWKQWQWRRTLHSSKLQHCWNITLRLFSVISRGAVGVFNSPSQLSNNWKELIYLSYIVAHVVWYAYLSKMVSFSL